MPIVGDHPESGVRFVLERPRAGGPPFQYEGAAFTPDARFANAVDRLQPLPTRASGASPLIVLGHV